MTKYLQTKRNSIEEAISSVVLDEKFSITLPPVRGGKKLLNIEMGRAIRMLKDFGATKNDIRNALSSRSFRFQNANGEMFLVQKEEVELDEAMKYNFMVLDPDGRVLGMSSGERQANDIAKNNLRKVRGRVVKLRKPMAQTRGDRLIGMLPADNLGEGTLNEQPEHEITVGNYTTKHFYMCGSAQTTMKKHADKEGAEELTRMQDMFYKMEKDAMDAGGANEEQKKKSQILYDKIMAKAKEVGIADEVDKYMKMHLDSMLKGDPKLGFGRTDIKESYQEMIARIMSQRSMR